MVGVQAEVGNDLTLDADRHINLLAAQNENTASASGEQSGGFLGIAASVGINGYGFKPAYGYEQAEYAMNNQGTWHSTNNFAVGGNVDIQAGNEDKGIIGDITSEGTKIIGMGNFNNSDVTLSATGDVTLTGVVNEVTSSSSGSSFGISNGMYDNIFKGGQGSYVASAQNSDMTDLALHGVSQGLSFLGGTEGIVQGVMSGFNGEGLFSGFGGLEGAIGGLGKGVDNLGGVNINYSDYSNNSQSQSVDKGAIMVGGNVSIESGRGGLTDGDINIISTDINAGGDFTFNAADGKGDMIVGALKTDNFANSDSNDFSFSFNPDAIMGGNLGDVSIGGGQSEYAGSGNDYAGSTITAGGTVSGQANDMSVIDSQITGDKVEIDVAGNLTIETTPDTWQGSGSSWNANIGTGGFGGGQGAITEDKNWTETPAGIFGKSEVDIDVGDTTKLIGGAIVSETDGGLELVTGKLEVEDIAINDYARDEYTGGQVNINLGGIVSGDIDHSNDTKKDDLFNENKYGTVEHSDVGHDKQGVVKGTISGGTVTVGGERDEDGNVIGGEVLDVAKLEDMGINTDSDNIVTITKDESWEESFKVDLINVGVAAEQVDNLVNVVESFTAKVPDHVKADGKEGEDIWRKAIANGMSQDEATSFASTQEYADLVNIRRQIEATRDETGRYDTEVVYTALKLEEARMQGFYDTNCASAPSHLGACAQLAAALQAMGGAESLSLESLNQMISGFEAMLSSGSSSAEDAYLQQIYGLAKDCKEQWVTSPSHMYDLYKDPEVDLAQELASVGYDDGYVNDFTLPAYEILYRLEQNHIDSVQAYEELNILRQSLADYQTEMDSTFLGEGLDSRGVDADYREGLDYLDSALEQLSLNVQSGSLEGNDLLLGSDGFGSSLLPDIEYGYTASTEEVLELATWMPIVGLGAESILCASSVDPSCIGSIASSTSGPAGKILIKGLDKAGNPIVKVVKKTEGTTKPLGSGGTAKAFEKAISDIKSPGEKLPFIKNALKQVAENHGWKKNNKLTKMNNRDVYEGKDGYLYAFDTQHGAFEKLDKRGKHLGEVDIDLEPKLGNKGKPNVSHGIKVK